METTHAEQRLNRNRSACWNKNKFTQPLEVLNLQSKNIESPPVLDSPQFWFQSCGASKKKNKKRIFWPSVGPIHQKLRSENVMPLHNLQQLQWRNRGRGRWKMWSRTASGCTINDFHRRRVSCLL